MAWNEPGDSKDKDPWGKPNPNNDQGPPDLDEVIRKLQNKLSSLFGGKGGGNDGKNSTGGGGGLPGGIGAVGLGVVAAIGLVVWLAFGFYIVAPAERGIVLHFGKFQSMTEPGLHWRLPYPIGIVEKVNVDEVRTAEIGYRMSGRGQNGITSVPSEALMLTQDENIIDIKFAIQYRIKNGADFLFQVSDPIQTLHQATESAVREVVGKSDMDFVLTEGRSDIASRVGSLTQGILDLYQTGLVITSVNMQDAQPPEQVQDAFHDAVKAREDEQRLINEAQAYSNDIIPKARGLAARQIEEGNAYKEQVVAKAEGEASRFTQIFAEYKKAPDVTRQRLYFETMEGVLANTEKVIIDVQGGNNMMFLPLDKLRNQQAGSSSTFNQFTGQADVAVPQVQSSAPPMISNRDASRSRERR